MDSLSKDLYAVVAKAINEFAELAASKCDVKKEELLELWNSRVSSELKVKPGKTTESKPAKKAASKPSADAAMCAYEFKKGANAGSSCTSKAREGSTFCNKHKGQEGKDSSPDDKKKAPAKKKESSKEKEVPAVKKMNEGKTKLSVNKNKHGNYEHTQTNLVLDKDSKEVYGKQVGDKVAPLSEEDIEKCKKFNFKYRLPVSLTSKKDKDDEEDEDEEKEDEEDVDEEEEDEDEDDDE